MGAKFKKIQESAGVSRWISFEGRISTVVLQGPAEGEAGSEGEMGQMLPAALC